MPSRPFHFPYFPTPFSLLIFIREKTFPENCQVSSNQRSSASTMKKSGFFAASVAAASATAISAPSSSGFLCNSKIQLSRDEAVAGKDIENSESQRSSSADRFAPRFDGLRFIETLVTAHR
ncbi:uncharacterized protein LOC100262522 [Vitis vinifera]|nr:uncharacterized protein LOC100262522 [Vitis vinifera]